MCRTTHQTHLLCQHTTSTTQACPYSFIPPSTSLLPNLFSIFQPQPPPKCQPSTGEILLNDFCPSCLNFWTNLGVGEDEARKRTRAYRQAVHYHGALTPVPSPEAGTMTFFRDEVEEDGMGREERVEEERYKGALDGWWRSGDEMQDGMQELETRGRRGSTSRDDILDGNQEPGPRSRQGTIGSRNALDKMARESRSAMSRSSSTETIWPGPGAAAARSRKVSEADIEDLRLGMAEVDEFGAVIELPLPMPAVLAAARDGLIHPDAFELVNLERELPGPTNGEGFERQRATRPVGLMPKTMPQRHGDVERDELEQRR